MASPEMRMIEVLDLNHDDSLVDLIQYIRAQTILSTSVQAPRSMKGNKTHSKTRVPWCDFICSTTLDSFLRLFVVVIDIRCGK